MTNHLTHLIDDIKYYKYIPKTAEEEVGAILTPKRRSFPRRFYNNMSNDLRHAYASAVITKDKGARIANVLGILNEVTDFGASGREDTKRDLRANAWGREYGMTHRNLSNQEMLKALYDDYLKRNY